MESDSTRATTEQFLAEARRELTSLVDSRAALATVARLAVPFLADWSVVDLREPDGRIERVAVAQAPPGDPGLEKLMRHYAPLPELKKGVWRVMQSGVAEIIPEVDDTVLVNAARDPVHLEFLRRLSIRSYLCVPLRARGQTLGTLMLLSTRPGRHYTETDLVLAEELACHVASSLENARLVRLAEQLRIEAEAHARRAELLESASRLLAGPLDDRATLSNLAQLGVRALADWCVVFTVDEHGVLARRQAAYRLPEHAEIARELDRYERVGAPPLRGVFLDVMSSGVSRLLTEVTDEELSRSARDEEHAALLRRLGLRSSVLVPMRARGRSLGVLGFMTCGDRVFGPPELALAEEVAARAALAIDNARLYRQAQEASRSRDEFIATVSHELRGPLAALLLWAEHLRADGLDPAQRRRALDAIHASARAQCRMIDDLIDVSRISTGKLRIVLRDASPAAIVRAAIDGVSRNAVAKSVALVWSVDDTLHRLACDPERIRQVLTNLLENAIKFTPSGGRVELRVERSGNEARFRVIDSGAGIAPELLPHVFDRFRQGEDATQRQNGLGLGLAIVKHIVEQHGGTARASSAGVGLGAELEVALPLVNPADLRVWEEPKPRNAPSLDGLRVLLVDDDRAVLEVLGDMLAGGGADVVTAAGAHEAMAAIEAQLPDVILSDIAMPGEDGCALMRRVRRHPDAKDVPAAALSGFSSPAHRRSSLEAGYQAHLVKPVELHVLLETVAALGASRGG
jgi:signal transduction histidine kinase